MRCRPSVPAKLSRHLWARLVLVLVLVQQAVAGGVLQTAHAMAMAGLGASGPGVLCSDGGRAASALADPGSPAGPSQDEHCPCCTLACCCTATTLPAQPTAGWRVHFAEATGAPRPFQTGESRPDRPRPSSDIATRGPPGITL